MLALIVEDIFLITWYFMIVQIDQFVESFIMSVIVKQFNCKSLFFHSNKIWLRREEPMASSTNNPRVFPMTLFYDDKAPLDQETKPTFQNPNSSEFPSQEQMQPNENAPQQKGDTLYNKSYMAGVANLFVGPFVAC